MFYDEGLLLQFCEESSAVHKYLDIHIFSFVVSSLYFTESKVLPFSFNLHFHIQSQIFEDPQPRHRPFEVSIN